ncbi:MAG: hypothetical protein R3251_03745 [Candidatus Spechtbacterales bacterium]|nr:hypothetical protein [Candidatus Spechtbacterales bacterium]
MEHKYIPRFVIVWTFYAWRFVAGAFGIKVERPWKEQFCTPFWLSILGLTIGLPIVLLAYATRLFLKSEAKEKIADAAGRFTNTMLADILLFVAMIVSVLTVLAVAGFLVYLLIKEPRVFLGILSALAIGASIILLLRGITDLAFFINSWHDADGSEVIEVIPEYRKKVTLARFLRKFVLVLFLPLIIAWKLAKFMGYMVYALYNRFCPRVELN